MATGKTNSGEDGVTLNLVNVPVVEAAKTILGDALNVNYTVSDKVTGNLTLQTSAPIQREALVDAFESALKISGATIVRSDGTYSIVPSNALPILGRPLGTSGDGQQLGSEVQILSFKNISASEMKRIIDPIVAQGAVLRVDAARNLLVVAGTARELSDVNALVRVFDVDWMKGMSVGLYPVTSSDPEVIATELETVMGLDKDGPLRGAVRVIPNRRLGSVMVMSSKPQYLDTARDWIENFESAALQTEPQLFVYKIQNRRAEELAAVLQSVLGTGTDTAPESQDVVAPRFEPASVTSDDVMPQTDGIGQESVSSATGGDTPPTREITRSSQDVPPEQIGSGKSNPTFRVGKTKIVADVGNNALLIEALPKEYKRISHILGRIDVLPTQVMLEAVIAEVSLNDELRFGLKWYFESRPSSFTFSDAAAGAVASAFPGFSYFFSTTSTKVALDALSEVTKVNVISAPSLMVMDNRKAVLQIGDQVPIVTQTAQSVTNPDAPVVNAVTMKDTGVILSVTPHVNDSGRVVLDVEQEVSNVTRTTSSGIDSPTIQQRRVTTTVVVNDGEVVALGGLIQQRDEASKSQIPLLGDLPVVGAAFRTKDDIIRKTELVIFIRPQVARDVNEARDITEEYRTRINLRPPMETRGNDHYRRDADRILR